MDAALSGWFWRESQCGEMIAAAARCARLEPMSARALGSDPAAGCDALGLECERIELAGGGLAVALRVLAPGAIEIPGLGFLLLARCGRSWARILTPALETQRIPLERLCAWIRERVEIPMRSEAEAILAEAGVPERRRARAARALLDERLKDRTLATAWRIRTRPGASFGRQIREAGLARRMAIFAAAHAAEVLCLIAAWAALGRGALTAGANPAWLTVWAALLFALIPLRLLTTWSQGAAAIGMGGLLKRRLLAGALLSDPDGVRGEGTGRLLGRVLEAEALEALALSGGLAALLALFEAAIAIAIMPWGAAPAAHPALFALWGGSMAALLYSYSRRRARWTEARLSMSEGLAERMAGHRTRLAQQPRAEHHLREDAELARYFELSERLDRAGARLYALPARGWLILGLAALAGPFFSNTASPGQFAIALGAMLLGGQALRRASAGAAQLAAAGIAWKQAAPLFHQAAKVPARANGGRSGAAAAAANMEAGSAAIRAEHIVYRYPGRTAAALAGCSLRIAPGDAVLLEGESGGGKSTLASIIGGMRAPDSGVLLAGGRAPGALGEAEWRRRVVAAPQYHRNHVLSAPLAFNLLMGRRWPARPEDLMEAAEVCRELGLGALLDRMPGGIMQMVGETGWQLSQGERSRVFLGRALLQQGDLVILDETFAALDPENLRQSMECALRRARSLLVIAHP